MMRRAVDVVVGALAVAVLAPVFAVIAIVIRLDSRGPVFYKATRVGLGGELFPMWKFRTMMKDADRVGPLVTEADDPRVTRVGAVLRRTKLDELPQFVNLLRGDLTLVGPRPEVPEIVERYTASQREILEVKPGIAGPNGLFVRAEESERIPPGVEIIDYYVEHLLEPKLQRDFEYLQTRTVLSDLRIVVGTAGYVLGTWLRPTRG